MADKADLIKVKEFFEKIDGGEAGKALYFLKNLLIGCENLQVRQQMALGEEPQDIRIYDDQTNKEGLQIVRNVLGKEKPELLAGVEDFVSKISWIEKPKLIDNPLTSKTERPRR